MTNSWQRITQKSLWGVLVLAVVYIEGLLPGPLHLFSLYFLVLYLSIFLTRNLLHPFVVLITSLLMDIQQGLPIGFSAVLNLAIHLFLLRQCQRVTQHGIVMFIWLYFLSYGFYVGFNFLARSLLGGHYLVIEHFVRWLLVSVFFSSLCFIILQNRIRQQLGASFDEP